MASTTTSNKKQTRSPHSNIHAKHPFARQGQTVFRLDNITPGSGFKSRISTSCAECKRLKIKCLKIDPVNRSNSAAQTSTSEVPQATPFPCLTCIKRGCEAICPQGVLVASDASKTHRPSEHYLRPSAIPQSQIQLKILEHQNSITALKRRVHELENALQDAHAKVSDDTHLLLQLGDVRDSAGLGDVNMPMFSSYNKHTGSTARQDHSPRSRRHSKPIEMRPQLNDNQTVDDGQSLAHSLMDATQNASERRDKSPRREEEPDILTRALGLLTIKEDGRSTYHAQNAGAWYYLQVSEDIEPNSIPSKNQTQYKDASSNFASPNAVMKALSLSAILTPDILYASRMFPMGGIDDADISSEILMRIRSYVPDCDEAMRLVDNYYAHSSWLYDPISRSHFMAVIFNVIYPFSNSNNSSPKSHSHPPSYSLTLATFFVVLAIGTHLDLDQPCGSPATNVYYHLARAAVASDRAGNSGDQSTNPAFNIEAGTGSGTETGMPACLLDPGLDVVRILLLMSYYLHMSDARTGYGASWALTGLATKLATGIGLHRDPTKWNLDPPETRFRQELFWELYTYDSWLSMPSGRPPSFLRIAIDLKRPYEPLLEKYSASTSPDPAKIDPEEILDVYKAWKHQFCFVKLVPTVEQAWGAQKPSYYTVLVLDRVLREQLENIPVVLRLPLKSANEIPASGSDPHSLRENQESSTQRSRPYTFGPGPQSKSYIPLEQYGLDWKTKTCLTMQRYTSFFLSQVALLLLHRPYFVHALNTSDQPLMTKFAASVLAVYRSSCTLIARAVELYALEPRLSPRIWYFWAQVFSAVTCLGGLVVRSPSLSIASSALANIEMACDLFEQIKDSNRTVRALPTMLKLRDRARLVYNAYQTQLARRSKHWDARGINRDARHSRSQNEGHGIAERFGDSGPEIPVPVLKEEEEDEISALVGETRLVDQRIGKSHMYSDSRSNIHAQSQSASPPPGVSFTTSASASSTSLAVPGPASYPYLDFSSKGTFESTSDSWFQPNREFATRVMPEIAGDSKLGIGDQTMSSQHTSHDSQPFDPFSLFRELGLNIASPGASAEAVADITLQTYPELDIPVEFQLSNENWIESLVNSGHGQQLPSLNADMNTNIDQSQDTDAALENFIAHVMRGYTSEFVDDISSNNAVDGHAVRTNMSMGFASDQVIDQNSSSDLVGTNDGSPNCPGLTSRLGSLDTFQSDLRLNADMAWTSTNVAGWQFLGPTSASSQENR